MIFTLSILIVDEKQLANGADIFSKNELLIEIIESWSVSIKYARDSCSFDTSLTVKFKRSIISKFIWP